MSQENIEVARSFYEAFLTDDPSSAERFVERGFEFVPARTHHIYFTAPSHGLEEFNRRYTELTNQFETYEARPEKFIDAGEDRLVAVLRRITKSHGVRAEERFGHVITMRGGRISRIVSFGTPAEALEAAGLRK